jgi:hypothetical protein
MRVAQLPQTLPGKGSSAKVRLGYAPLCRVSHHEKLLERLVHVARYGFNLTVWQLKGRTSPVSGHAPGSMHYRTFRDGLGEAFDAFGAESDMRAFGAFVNRWAPQVDEGIHNPGLSRKNGRGVPSSVWGSATWSAHRNHVHIGNA